MSSFKFSVPKRNAPAEQWQKFSLMAPHAVVEEVYYGILHKNGYEKAREILSSRLKIFDRPLVRIVTDTSIMVAADTPNEEIKKQVAAVKQGIFPAIVCEVMDTNPAKSFGWFRGLAVNRELVFAGVVSLSMNVEEACALVRKNGMSLLTVDDVVAISERLTTVREIFRNMCYPLRSGRYWIEGQVADENLVWTLGSCTKFACAPEGVECLVAAKI